MKKRKAAERIISPSVHNGISPSGYHIVGGEPVPDWMTEAEVQHLKEKLPAEKKDWPGPTVLRDIKTPVKDEINRRAQVLQEAERLINGDRAQTYGPPEVSFGRIAELWTAMGFRMVDASGDYIDHGIITAVDVALALIQLKVSRTISSPDHEDNWVDIAGYAGLGAEMALRNERNG